MLFIEKNEGKLNEQILKPKHRIQSASNVNRIRNINKTNQEN
jgi:hypothetical protein